MTFSSEEEQIKRFEEDMVAQDYIAVLRALISKKSIFAQQVGLQEVAAYLKEIFIKAGAEVELDESYTAPFVIAKFKSQNPTAKTIIFTTIMIQFRQIVIKFGQMIRSLYLFGMVACMVVESMMTKGILLHV